MSSKLLGGRNRQKSPRLRSARAFATEVGGDEAIRHNARHRCPSDHAGRNAAGARYWLKTSSFSTRHLDENPPWLLPWSTPQRAAGRRGTRHVLVVRRRRKTLRLDRALCRIASSPRTFVAK